MKFFLQMKTIKILFVATFDRNNSCLICNKNFSDTLAFSLFPLLQLFSEVFEWKRMFQLRFSPGMPTTGSYN